MEKALKKHLQKKYLCVINPALQAIIDDSNRQKDKIRDQTPKRKSMHALIDKERDKTLERKKMHSAIDEKRNKRSLTLYSSYCC